MDACPPPRKKVKTAKRVENEADEAALKEIQIENVPECVMKLLQAAAADLNHEDIKPRQTQFGLTKRTQGTFGSNCKRPHYLFAKHQSPITEARGAMLELLENFAKERDVDVSRCIVHVNYYPEKTQAGVDAHQDDEPIIDQGHPIVAYQTGGSAMLHVWSSKPNGRAGACVEISESQSYVMPAGFQDKNFHSIRRHRKKHVEQARLSFTFRVVT